MISKKTAFTICTGSYRGFGEALKKSFLRYNSGYDFYIFFTDQISLDEEYSVLCDDVFKEYDSEINLDILKFKYDIVEYATCAKPFCFKYLFSRGYEQVIYFDPDILFYSKFEELDNQEVSVFLTPHILSVPKNDLSINYEEAFLRYGMYNCGFVCFNNKPDSMKFIDWWARRLIDRSFASADAAYYTDQKWVDFIPSFMEMNHINIVRNIGCNFASWNFSEREIQIIDDKFYVKQQESLDAQIVPLVFMHYSGYNFRELLVNEELFIPADLEKYKSVYPLVRTYKDALAEVDTLSYMNIRYKYGFYENGDKISLFQRRVFNGLLSKNSIYDNPFECSNKSFYNQLLRKHFKLCSDVPHTIEVGQSCKDNASKKGRKQRRMIPLFRLLFRLLGEQKYVMLLLALRPYLNYDNNEFLIDRN